MSKSPSTASVARFRPFEDQVFVMFLEHDFPQTPVAQERRRRQPFGVRIIDWLIRVAQPKPTLAHVELITIDEHDPVAVPPAERPPAERPPGQPPTRTARMHTSHFATYLGESADWQDSGPYYVDATQFSWRALPIHEGLGLQARVRSECQQEEGAPYSLSGYLFAWRPVRDLLYLFGRGRRDPRHDTRGESGHCGTVTARVLQHACTRSDLLPRHPTAYGPSTLYRSLARYLLRTSVRSDQLADTLDPLDPLDPVEDDTSSIDSRSELVADATDAPDAADAANNASKAAAALHLTTPRSARRRYEALARGRADRADRAKRSRNAAVAAAEDLRVYEPVHIDTLLTRRPTIGLLSRSDEELLSYDSKEAALDVEVLCDLVITALHGQSPEVSADAERLLARAVSRWSQCTQCKAQARRAIDRTR